MHEAAETRDKDGNKLESSFVTLTYDEEHYEPSLNYKDFQMFMDRLRAKHGKTRYFACGEYGDENNRPHFHACLFGKTFSRDYKVNKEAWGSKELDRLWAQGYASHGTVTYQSAAYVAGYVVKKLDGDKRITTILDERTGELVTREPEMGHMSLKPGIGTKWFLKYHKEQRVRDGIVQPGGKVLPLPKAYDKLLAKLDLKTAADHEWTRNKNRIINEKENTQERLKVREEIMKRQQKDKIRKI